MGQGGTPPRGAGRKGVLIALLERVDGSAFTVAEGTMWKKIRKYRAGKHASAEERNVLGLALQACETQCSALVFSRDRDGDVGRERKLERGIQRARELFPNLEMIGGVAVENIEAWILVLLGYPGERLSPNKTKPELEARGIATLDDKLAVVAKSRLDEVPPGSLRNWLENARDVFARTDACRSSAGPK